MNQTYELWSTSPAQRLTLSNYLPEHGTAHYQQSIAQAEQQRKESVLDGVALSADEFGRTDADRLIYLEAMGHKYGEVDFLARAEELKQISDMVAAGTLSLEKQDPEVTEAIIEDIHHLNSLGETLFGPFHSDRYGALVARATRDAERLLDDPNTAPSVTAASERLLDTLPTADMSLVDSHLYKPSPELLATWKPRLEKKYSSLLKLVPADRQDTFDASEVAGQFTAAISILSTTWKLPNAETWTVLRGGKPNINVDLETKTVWVPESKVATPSQLRGLLVHEIGGHLLRNLLGELSGDPFLATDLPGRSADEEALFSTYGQILSGVPREAGINYYMAVGLATQQAPVPLDKLEQTLVDYATVSKGKPLSPLAISATQKQAFRVTRGMPSIRVNGALHQAVYPADLKYAIGQPHAVSFLQENINNPAALDIVTYGKFAYSRPDQLAYALRKHHEHARSGELLRSLPSAV